MDSWASPSASASYRRAPGILRPSSGPRKALGNDPNREIRVEDLPGDETYNSCTPKWTGWFINERSYQNLMDDLGGTRFILLSLSFTASKGFPYGSCLQQSP